MPMRRTIGLSVAILAILAGVAFALQQTYPNEVESELLLENDRVVVQRMTFPAGEWQGEHSHPGNQLAVVITEIEQVVKEGGQESTRVQKPGDILWVEKGSHDHKMVKGGTAVLITLK